MTNESSLREASRHLWSLTMVCMGDSLNWNRPMTSAEWIVYDRLTEARYATNELIKDAR